MISQHTNLSEQTRLRQGLDYAALPQLYRLLLPWADGIVAVSHGVATDLTAYAGVPPAGIAVVHNPIVTPELIAKAAELVDHPWLACGQPPVFLSVGRLVEQKDYPTLLRGFAKVRAQRSARLLVLGEGPLLAALEALAGDLGVAEHVEFAGFRANPFPFITAAAAVVLASRYEGFGNVLAEALACGTPVVSTDCPSGPAEILEHGRYGELVGVGDSDGIAAAMIRVLDVPPDGELLRRGAERFSAAAACDRYLELFSRILDRRLTS